VRRSKRQSLGELVRMYGGIYPFRCMDCDTRFWVSVWLFSKLPFAKCPKCLNVQLSIWPAKYFAPSVWRTVAVLFGARHYRCMPCRYNFVSFRPTLVAPRAAEAHAAEHLAASPDLVTEPILAVDTTSAEKP